MRTDSMDVLNTLQTQEDNSSSSFINGSDLTMTLATDETKTFTFVAQSSRARATVYTQNDFEWNNRKRSSGFLYYFLNGVVNVLFWTVIAAGLL